MTAEISELYRRWFAAAPAQDFAFFEYALADEWTYTDIDGIVRGKRDYIELLRLVQPDHRSRLDGLSACVYGEVAVALGSYEVHGVLCDGKDVSSSTRFTSVWRRTPEGWKAVVHHATRAQTPEHDR